MDTTTGLEFEYWVLRLPPAVSRAQARLLLAEHAEYGRWELDRVRLMRGGSRTVRLRRRIIRVRRTA
ncbi:MAG: DUF5703 family protein [Angustibacter sp.]